MSARRFDTFDWKDARYRICSPADEPIRREIVEQRRRLEEYIRRQPAFGSSLTPVNLLPGAPDIALRMASAAEAVGVGPMASVAGAIAQAAAEAGLAAGADEAIVENGGDIFAVSPEELVVGLYAGRNPIQAELAVVLEPCLMPLSVCSSSSRMGHSLSLGRCDLACVAASDAAVADAAATRACNLVRGIEDIQAALEEVASVRGVRGLLICEGDRVGLAGEFPPIVRPRPESPHAPRE